MPEDTVDIDTPDIDAMMLRFLPYLRRQVAFRLAGRGGRGHYDQDDVCQQCYLWSIPVARRWSASRGMRLDVWIRQVYQWATLVVPGRLDALRCRASYRRESDGTRLYLRGRGRPCEDADVERFMGWPPGRISRAQFFHPFQLDVPADASADDDMDVREALADTWSASADQVLDFEERVAALLECAGQRDRAIMLDLLSGYNMAQAAERNGLSRERVRQIRNQAGNRARAALGGDV